MSTLRHDPTTRQWVILAPVRHGRPGEGATRPRLAAPPQDPTCPFCPGNEDETPPEILREPLEGDWRVRVVPNLYGALAGGGLVTRTGPPMFREAPGVGGHELVIESARHDARFDEMPQDDVVEVVRIWRGRFRELVDLPSVRAVVVFKNFGPLAGTSLVHPHSQIVAVPVFLPRLLRRLEVARRYLDENGTSLYDDLLAAERKAGERIIEERGRFVALEPWASESPFETWIVPTTHEPSFRQLADEDIPDLARLLTRVLGAIRRACADPDLNVVVSSAPADGEREYGYVWHLRILPKLSTPAGFEIGSGMSINTVPPEDAALALRSALAEAEWDLDRWASEPR